MLLETRRALFRDRNVADSDKVTNTESFFDLVFAFATTQMSSRLVTHFTLVGGIETLELFLAVWWLWMFTAWSTNWLNPEKGAVRTMLMLVMLGSLLMSAAVPNAFGATGMAFAASYTIMQLLRTAAIAVVSIGVNNDRFLNFVRIIFYFLMATPLWVWGATLTGNHRLLAWGAALAIEYIGPIFKFVTPFLGSSKTADWDIAGGHMAERTALFVVIALGEAIVETGATFAGLAHDAPTVMAMITSFVSSAALWWIYFDSGAKRAGQKMAKSEDAGRLGRSAYTYLHMPIVAAIIVTAVADELMLAHPLGQALRHAVGETAGHAVEQTAGRGGLPYILVACGGPLLFLIGNQVFKWITAERRRPPLSHFVGEGLIVLVAICGLVSAWTPLTIGIGATGALIATAGWEWLALNCGWQSWVPWIGKRTAIALEHSER